VEPTPAPSEQELQITRGLESLRDATAREMMTPRVDVVALPAPVTYSAVVAAVRRSGRSHYPVYEDDLDHLVGVLFVKDLFQLRGSSTNGLTPDTDPDVTSRARQPYVVPESRSALEILSEMRRGRRGFAIVVDEYGGFAGVLTINDLVSELVGDLHDEFDSSSSPAVLRIDSTRYLVDGSCSVDEVVHASGAPIPEGEYVTLGGYLLDALGHIPVEGETLDALGWSYRVTKMDRRRIAKIVITAPSATIADGSANDRTDGK
jgi:CBS domain containing-hemolysin-like protein